MTYFTAIQDCIGNVLEDKDNVPVILSIAIIFMTVVYYFIKNRGLPPGPIGLPYFGYFPFLKKDSLHLQFEDLRKKYGDVFSFTVTGKLYINLPTVKVIREAHITKSDCFAGRTEDYCLLTLAFKEGLGFANGEQWKVARKFFLGQLKERMSLANKDSVNAAMYDSVKAAVEELKEREGAPVKIMEIVVGKCNTVLKQYLFGHSDVTEKQLLEINDAYASVLHSMSATNLLVAGTFAKYFVFPFLPHYRKALKDHALIEKLIFQIIDDHKASYKEDNLRDVIDCFFKERNDRRAKGDPTADFFTDRCLMATLYQFIGDGILSVAGFVSVYLKMMADRPQEQEKIFQEISEVVGLDRQPTVEDKTRLPYTNAFILELLRTSDFFPFFPSLECTKETTINGYRIPQGAMTLMNTWSAQNDPSVYEEPSKFDPTRFLPKEGKQRPELPVTFGVGKRACIGESFTMTQVFLFLTTLVQNFKLSYNDGGQNVLDFLLSEDLTLYVLPRTK